MMIASSLGRRQRVEWRTSRASRIKLAVAVLAVASAFSAIVVGSGSAYGSLDPDLLFDDSADIQRVVTPNAPFSFKTIAVDIDSDGDMDVVAGNDMSGLDVRGQWIVLGEGATGNTVVCGTGVTAVDEGTGNRVMCD